MLLFEGLESYGLLVLRVFLGIIFIYHGIPKLKMPEAMAKGMGKSTGFVVLLGLAELLAGLALALGFYAEIGALITGLIMLGALYYKIFAWKVSFFAMDKMGWEFDLMLLGASVAVLLLGAGNISLSSLLGFG